MRTQRRPVSIASRSPDPAMNIVDALRQALPGIETRAARDDQTGRFPAQDVRLLADIGLLKAFAGAADQCARDRLFDCLRLLGRASLSLGRIFEGHVNAIGLIERYGDEAVRDRLKMDLDAGRLFGVWNTELAPGVELVCTSTAWRLRGAKSFATGAGHLDRVVVTARLPDGGKQMLILPVGDRPERANLSGWRVRGMRATASGMYDFSGWAVQPDTLVGWAGDYEREPMFTAGAWRFTAVQLGAIEALVGLHRQHLRRTGSDADPVQRARFGRAVAAARTAYQWVREASRRADGAATADAPPFVLLTRGVVEEAALTVIDAAQRAVGTQSFFTANPIDRITRDLGLYLRQPAPDGALDRAAQAWLDADRWSDDPWW